MKTIPKPETIKGTEMEWAETANKIGLDDKQKMAVIEIMKMIKSSDSDTIQSKETKEKMINECKMLAKDMKIDDIPEPESLTKEIRMKWDDVKDEKHMMPKMKFWSTKYKIWDDEELKMKAMKNWCVMMVENAERDEMKETAKEAGLSGEDMKNMVDLMMLLKNAKGISEEKMMMKEHCDKVGMDGMMMNMKMEQTRRRRNAMMMMMPADWDKMDSDAKINWLEDKMDDKTMKPVMKVKIMKNICVLTMDKKLREENTEWAKKMWLHRRGNKSSR